MYHFEKLCSNPITGRVAYALRSIPSGVYGTPFDWSAVIVKPSYFSSKAIVMLIQGITIKKRKELQEAILAKGFTSAEALEKGKWYTWNNKGVRRA